MLEGLEISEVGLREILSNNRIDAECYQKAHILLSNEIIAYPHKTLSNIAEITDGEHGSPKLDEESGIVYLSGHNIKNNFIDYSDIRYCDRSIHEKNARSALKVNNVLLSIVGTVGNASVIYEDIEGNTDRNVATIKKIHGVNPYYLSTFLNSKYGKYQTRKLSTGNVQPLLNLIQVKSIIVCLPSDIFQKEIEQLVRTSHDKAKQAFVLYNDAENVLLEELNLKNWQPENNSYNIKQLKESLGAGGRLDAEYYQPKYDDLFEKLSHYRCNTISEIATIKKSIEPGSDAYCDSGVPFVRVSDITKFGISEPAIYLSRSDYNVSELHPKKDTILLSKDGSVGIAYKVEEDMDCITSGALLHLNVYNQDYLPDYVTLVLNSIVVRMQAERDSNGAIIQHWKPSEIEQVVIPYLPMETQRTIAEKIRQSIALRSESKRLLAKAKKLVEQEIENH